MCSPLTLDYSSHTVYWIDYCSYRIESLNMNGDSSTHSAPVSKTIAFPSGITQLEDMIYWTEPTQIFAVNKTRGEPVVQLYRGYSNNKLGGLEIVHTSKQPPSMFWLSNHITQYSLGLSGYPAFLWEVSSSMLMHNYVIPDY